MAKKAKTNGGTKKPGAGIPYERRVVQPAEGHPPSVKALYVERRGIREQVTPVMDDPVEQFVAYMRSEDHPANRFEELQKRASEIMKATGIKPLKEVFKDIRTRGGLGINADPEKELDFVADDWWERITAAVGKVTPEGCAVRFVYWAHRLDRLAADTTQARVLATLHFADAWHWLHMEAYGEHVAAHGGVKRKQDLAKSAPARRGRKALSESILEEVYLERRSKAKSQEAFKRASSAAPLILADVNARLRERNLDEYSELTLSKKLGPIMKRVGR